MPSGGVKFGVGLALDGLLVYDQFRHGRIYDISLVRIPDKSGFSSSIYAIQFDVYYTSCRVVCQVNFYFKTRIPKAQVDTGLTRMEGHG